jgi:DNA (cytosine-5)-methyltransferase 1
VRGRAQEGGVVVKLGSLFDGIGGFPLAAVRNGIEPVWASEIEQVPIEITKQHFPNMVHLGDITQINGAEIEPVDIITAGSPCQDLSVAGKREGLEGERSGLFMEFVRIVREMREATNGAYPKFIVWENVPGAFSSNKGADFRAVLEEIMEAEIPMPYSGKWATSGMVRGNGRSLAWRVLDAQYWGVPQRRKRIFLVADFTGGSAAEILFEQEGVRGDFAESREAREEVATTTREGIEGTSECLTPWGVQSRRIYPDDGTWPALYGGEGGGRGYVAQPLPFDTTQITSKQNGSKPKPGDPCHPLCASAHPPTIAFNSVEQSPTLRAGGPVRVAYPVFFGPGGQHDIAHALRAQPSKADKPSSTTYVVELRSRDGVPGVHGVAYGIRTANEHLPSAIIKYGAFAQNQRDEVRDLGDKAGALQAKPGMRQQTFVLQGSICAIDCRNLRETEQSGTLQAKSSGGYSLNYQNPVRVGYAVRRLTPTECERLMGFPDDWTVGHSDTARYKVLGNSVAVPCVEWIMRQIAGRGANR